MKPISPALCLVALLAGCTVGPDFQAPDQPATKSYTTEEEALNTEQHIALGKEVEAACQAGANGNSPPSPEIGYGAAASAHSVCEGWWTLFASPPLDDVIKQAITANYEFAAAKETLAQAQEAVNAESGGLLPQVALDGTAGKQKYGVALFGPTNFHIPPFAYYEAGPSVLWDTDLFGGKRRSIERQEALAEYQAHELDAAYVTLTGNVAAMSFTIAAAKAEIDATGQIIAEDEKTLKLVREAFQAGSNTKLDILSAQSQLDSDQALLPPMRQRLSISRHALSILLGKAPADWTPPDFELSNFTLPQELPVSLPSELAAKRPDILAAQANLHAASAAIGVATANLYPNITLSANLLQEALTPANMFQGASNAWALAAALTAPVFSGGTLSAEKREAEHAYQAALAEYEQTILRAFGQVADALTALQHDNESIASEQQAVNTASASLALARKSYQAGNTGLLQIQDAGRQLARARLGLTRAQSQRFLDTAQLFVALGGSPFTK